MILDAAIPLEYRKNMLSELHDRLSDKEAQLRQHDSSSEAQIRQLAANIETQKDIIHMLKSQLTAKTLDFEFVQGRLRARYIIGMNFILMPLALIPTPHLIP
jgi:peptidoglycan hydrolase CwlO-like protein